MLENKLSNKTQAKWAGQHVYMHNWTTVFVPVHVWHKISQSFAGFICNQIYAKNHLCIF